MKELQGILDLPSKVLELVVKILHGVGVVLSPFLIQLFLLTLVLVLLLFLVIKSREKSKGPLELLEIVGLGLIAFAIVFSWVEQTLWPFPKEIEGRIEIMESSGRNLYPETRVKLLDSRGQVVSVGTGFVDTGDGSFGLRFNASFGDRPQTIRVTAPGCKDQEYPISRTELRRGILSTRQFGCGGQ